MIKQLKWIPAAMMVAGLMTSCGSGEQKDAAAETKTEQAAVINTTHAYICPMNCENSASMEPGLCKVCGMELVKNPNYTGATTDTTSAVADTTAGENTKDDEGHDDHEGHNH